MTVAWRAHEPLERRPPVASDAAERVAARAPLPSEAELGRFLESVLARPAQAPLTVLALPVLAADGTRLLDSLARSDAFALAPVSGPDVVALGVAARATVAGPDRFAHAEASAREIFAGLELAPHPDAPIVAPRIFCGFAFAPGSARAEHWRAFGDGVLVLPRWSYFSGLPGGRAVLHCVLDRRLDHPGRLALVRSELEAILATLTEPPADGPRVVVSSVRAEAPELHGARVSAALAEIESGRAEKIVVSRHAEALADRSFEAGATYRALARGARRNATAFLVRRAGASFLGATPEHLLTVRGSELRTEALAGTAPSGDRTAAARLLGSEKDLVEHRLVVDAIAGALGPLAATVSIDGAPSVTTAGPVLHLRTRIAATLARGVHPLEVAGRLHPTPAVAGAPRDVATRLIERAEPGRGWYAGPLGWLDAAGDAELVVALRSGLIRGGRALAFAGGGIVRGSKPDEERIETELKMRPFLEALGAELRPRGLSSPPGAGAP